MIIEKVSRSGVVLDHFQFANGTIKVGRAYDNDLILHDVYVEDKHISLHYDEANSGFWFEDLGSTNGTQVERSQENKHKKVPPNFINSGDTLCLGKTWLKVRSRVQDVPAAVKISLWDKALGVSGSPWCITFICLVLLVLETLDQFISDPRVDKLGSKTLESFNLLFIVIGYGVVWAFIARVQKSEPRLLVHASLVAWCMLFFSLVDFLKPIVYFNTSLVNYIGLIDLLINSLAIFLVVWASLYLATELKKLYRLMLAALIPFGLMLGLIVERVQKPEYVGYPQYDSIVVPPEWQLGSGITRQQYLENADDLYSRAEKALKELDNGDEEAGGVTTQEREREDTKHE